MAATVFPDHVGPFLLRDCGHFVPVGGARAARQRDDRALLRPARAGSGFRVKPLIAARIGSTLSSQSRSDLERGGALDAWNGYVRGGDSAGLNTRWCRGSGGSAERLRTASMRWVDLTPGAPTLTGFEPAREPAGSHVQPTHRRRGTTASSDNRSDGPGARRWGRCARGPFAGGRRRARAAQAVGCRDRSRRMVERTTTTAIPVNATPNTAKG